MKLPINQGCIAILTRLYHQRRIGGRHIPETICLRWIKNLPKSDYRNAIKDWERCIKEGIVLTKPKPTERHVFLNPKRIPVIKELIK